MYKEVYQNVIKQKEEITRRTKEMNKAAVHIHTNHITGNTKPIPEEIRQHFKRQRAKLGVN